MSPDNVKRRPLPGAAFQEIAGGDTSSIAPAAVTAPAPRWTGCPCGCLTKLPWFDDPDCVRHLPTPEPRDYGGYDAAALGLATHDRERCEPCSAVGR